MKNKSHNVIMIILFLITLLPFVWLRDGSILLGHDNVYPLNPLDFLRDRIYSWSSNLGIGMDQSGVQGSLIFHTIDSIPQFLGLTPTISQRIVFSFWFFAMMFSSYLLMSQLEKRKYIDTPYAKYFVPVLYSVNFYILQAWWVAERAKFSLVAVTPLVLTLLFPIVKERMNIRLILWRSGIIALLLTVFNAGGWGGFPLYGGFIVVCCCFYLFVVAMKCITKQFADIFSVSLLYILILCWFFLLNAYTLVPFLTVTLKNMPTLSSVVGGVQGQISWARYISENTSIINLLRLQGIPDWYNNGIGHPYAQTYLIQPFFIAASFVFPALLILLYTIFARKSRGAVAFFSLLFIVSLFFTAGTHNPFGKIYELFMRRIPGFFIFRTPIYKFGYAYWLATSVLIGMSISYVIERFISRFRTSTARNGVALGLVIITIFGLLGYHFPYLTGDIFHVTSGPQRMNVRVPEYVNEFARWWRSENKNDKILLLPRLNETWLFEKYSWNYESLYPLLGNYGSIGLVENLESMQTHERLLTDLLYESIENKEYQKMRWFSTMLGVRYFLVRGDFAHTVENQQTTDLDSIRQALELNPDIQLVISFGPWNIYEYREDIPLITAVGQVDLLSGDLSSLLQSEQILSGRDILISKDNLDGVRNNIESIYIVPQCISCAAETVNFPVIFPETRILPDSPLYQLILQKNTREANKLNGESYVFALVGKTLKMVSELNELNKKNKSQYIPQISEEYVQTIHEIENKTDEILNNNSNPYNFIASLVTYLQAESSYIYYNVFSPQKEVLLAIQNALFTTDSLIEKLKKSFDMREYAIKKIYSFTVPVGAKYQLLVQDHGNGSFTDTSSDIRSLLIDGIPATSSSMITLDQGNHILGMQTREPSNMITQTVPESIAGSSCFSSYGASYSSRKSYRLEFMGRNDFSDRFYLFVDGGGKFAPIMSSSLATIGNRLTKHEFIIENESIPIKGKVGNIRVSFCAPELTEETYKESIRELKLTEILVPKIFLKSIDEHVPLASSPSITFIKKDPVTYTVHIANATKPFFLVFRESFSLNWTATFVESRDEGNSILRVENGFTNIWFVSKPGTYVMRLTYKPQKYFVFGCVISALSGIILLSLLYRIRRTQHL